MAHALTLLRSGWGWFRNWRRTRPFWGGALLIAAGIELLVAPAAQSLILPIDLVIYAGIAGVSGPVIAFLLIALGVLSWLQPAQHVFFGLVGLMLALVSFVTSNFGGFVIGMLLGIVGGALVFAWAPNVQRRSRGRRRAGVSSSSPEDADDTGEDTDDASRADDTADPEAKDSDTSVGDTPDTRTGAHAETRSARAPGDDAVTETIEPVAEPRDTPRYLAAIALPLAAAVTIASAPAPTLGWPWDWLFPGDDEEQSEEQPSEEPSDEAPEEPGETDPGDDGSEEPADGDTEDESDEDDEEELEEDEEGNPEECELRIGDAAVVEDEEDFLAAVLACQAAQEEDEYPEVMVDSDYDCFRGSVRDSGLTADSLTMYGARYRGVVECPTDDGPQRYIRLSMSSGDVRGGELWFDDLGARRSLGLPTMNMTGDVEMFVTRMHVRILGIPLTFTPDFPPPLLLPFMYVTGVDVDNPLASTDLMTIPDLNGQYGGGS